MDAGDHLKHFEWGLFLNDYIEDGKKGRDFISGINSYLDKVGNGFDSIWIPDHFSPRSGVKDVLEGITTVSFLSAKYPKHKLGTLVLCNNFRNPALTAKMGATLNQLTGGRFILGIGAGWFESEFREYGFTFPPGHVRAEINSKKLSNSSRRYGPRITSPSRENTTQWTT